MTLYRRSNTVSHQNTYKRGPHYFRNSIRDNNSDASLLIESRDLMTPINVLGSNQENYPIFT